MKKTLTLIFTLCVLGLAAQNAQVRQLASQHPAQTPRNIPATDIQYWVGSGSNQAIATFFFCREGDPIGIAYGYRWNGTATIQDLLNDLAAADSRFSYNASSGFISTISYSDDNYNLTITDGMMMYTVNGSYASGLSDDLPNNGYFQLEEWSYDCASYTDDIIVPVADPNPVVAEDATIDAEQIQYWVGNGSSEVVFAVNWCNPSVAMAWGVRFDGDSALVSDIMNTVAIYDERISFVTGAWGISDLLYHDATHNLALTGQWWMFNVNGATAMNGYDAQYVRHGDIIKWGDESCGLADANYNYTWETAIEPVALPADTLRTFDGIAGTPGCQALSYDDNAILGWATQCTVTRGPQDIANGTPLASYGDESTATGPASLSTADAISLGDGGMATLTFSTPISNGEGYDFAVFENSLNDVFLELAFVEVSSDGEHFYRFPAVSGTQVGAQVSNAGSVDATLLHNLAGKYRVGFGTPFDLEELAGYSNLDINNITHVRIVDAVGSIDPTLGTRDRYGRLVNDPYPTDFASSGFDLTGVAVLNGWTPNAVNEHTTEMALSLYPNPCHGQCVISGLSEGTPVQILDATGKLVRTLHATAGSTTLQLGDLPQGFYLVRCAEQTAKLILR